MKASDTILIDIRFTILCGVASIMFPVFLESCSISSEIDIAVSFQIENIDRGMR